MRESSAPASGHVTGFARRRELHNILPISVSDGTFDAIVFSAGRGAPVVVLLHDTYGVNDDIKKIALELAEEGFTVVCPELFWRVTPTLPLSAAYRNVRGQWALEYPGLDVDRATLDVVATVASASVLSRSGKVAVLGFGPGGLLALHASGRARVDAAVGYCDAWTYDFRRGIRDVRSPLLIHLPDDDRYMPLVWGESTSNSGVGNALVEVHVYKGRDRGFIYPGGSSYHRKDAATANGRTIAFLRSHLVFKDF